MDLKIGNLDRRSFIRHAGRYMLLSAIAALGVYGIYKRKKVPVADCSLADYCRTCAELASCSLPEAIRERTLQ